MATEQNKTRTKKKSSNLFIDAFDEVDESRLGKGAIIGAKGRAKRQRELDAMKKAQKQYQKGKKKNTRPLSSLSNYGK